MYMCNIYMIRADGTQGNYGWEWDSSAVCWLFPSRVKHIYIYIYISQMLLHCAPGSIIQHLCSREHKFCLFVHFADLCSICWRRKLLFVLNFFFHQSWRKIGC